MCSKQNKTKWERWLVNSKTWMEIMKRNEIKIKSQNLYVYTIRIKKRRLLLYNIIEISLFLYSFAILFPVSLTVLVCKTLALIKRWNVSIEENPCRLFIFPSRGRCWTILKIVLFATLFADVLDLFISPSRFLSSFDLSPRSPFQSFSFFSFFLFQ